jgi:hypothetical protein
MSSLRFDKPKVRWRRWLGWGGLLAFVMLALVWSQWPEAETPRVSRRGEGNTSPSAPQILAFPRVDRLDESASAAAPGERRPVASRLRLPGESLSQTFDRLAASGSPQQAFEAYAIATHCEALRAQHAQVLAEHEPAEERRALLERLPPIGEVCGDLTPEQFSARIELLSQAATAGVHGARTAVLEVEGPEGTSHAIPDGNEYRQLVRTASDAGFRSADPGILRERSAMLTRCAPVATCRIAEHELADALMYRVAANESSAADDGRAAPSPDPLADQLAGRLPATLASRAVADAKAFVKAARQQR